MSAFSAWSKWIGWNEWNEGGNSCSHRSSSRRGKTARRVRAEIAVRIAALIEVATARRAGNVRCKAIALKVEETIADFAAMDVADAIDFVVEVRQVSKATARRAERRTTIRVQRADLTVALRSLRPPRERLSDGSMRPVMVGFCASLKTATCQNRPTRSSHHHWCARINCAVATSWK